METLKFKTNIKCSGCITAVTPHLNNMPGIAKWQVDTNGPDKILTVQAESPGSQEVIQTLEKAGYKAEQM